MHARKAAPPAPQRSYRWDGLALVAVGIATSYLFIYPAIVLLQLGALGTSLGKGLMMGIGVTPIALGYGLLYLLGGPWAVKVFGPPYKQSMLGNLVGFALMAIGVALFAWLDSRLKLPG
jgi:uncharacterized protein YjeT (DUF2065 family)